MLCWLEVEELNVEGNNCDKPCGMRKGNEKYKKGERGCFKYLIAIPPRFVFISHLFYTVLYQKWLFIINLCQYTDFGPYQDSPGILSLTQF